MAYDEVTAQLVRENRELRGLIREMLDTDAAVAAAPLGAPGAGEAMRKMLDSWRRAREYIERAADAPASS